MAALLFRISLPTDVMQIVPLSIRTPIEIRVGMSDGGNGRLSNETDAVFWFRVNAEFVHLMHAEAKYETEDSNFVVYCSKWAQIQ